MTFSEINSEVPKVDSEHKEISSAAFEPPFLKKWEALKSSHVGCPKKRSKPKQSNMTNSTIPGRHPALKHGGVELPSPETIQAHLVAAVEPLAYDIKQAAAKLNTSTKTIRRLLQRGRLTCCRELRKILIPREQIDNFFKKTCDKPNLGL